MKYLFFFGIVFVGNVSVISHAITESPIILPKYLPLSKAYVIGFQIQFFTSTFSQTLHWHWHLLLFYFWLELYFVPSNLDLHSQNTGFVNVFYSFFLIIILKALKFLSFVLFGADILLDGSARVLQFPLDLSKSSINV